MCNINLFETLDNHLMAFGEYQRRRSPHYLTHLRPYHMKYHTFISPDLVLTPLRAGQCRLAVLRHVRP